jgi:hypothetical protein
MLETLEKAFYVIGDRFIAMSVGSDKFNGREIRTENVTPELIIRTGVKHDTVVVETRETLSRLTKGDICSLSVERFGVDLNHRLNKLELIAAYLEEQDT